MGKLLWFKYKTFLFALLVRPSCFVISMGSWAIVCYRVYMHTNHELWTVKLIKCFLYLSFCGNLWRGMLIIFLFSILFYYSVWGLFFYQSLTCTHVICIIMHTDMQQTHIIYRKARLFLDEEYPYNRAE